MTITWSLTREQIADRALQKCQRLGVGEAANADDRSLCLTALDAVLKNLLWRGYSWPKTASSSTPLSFLAGAQTKQLPADFYTGEALYYVDPSGNEVAPVLGRQTAEQWRSIPLKSTQAQFPDRFYIDNFNVLWLYPIPNAALTLNLYYQKVISDSVGGAVVDLDSPWMLGLAYGVAAEVGHEFGVPPPRIQVFAANWERQLNLGVMNEAPPGPDRMTVSD